MEDTPKTNPNGANQYQLDPRQKLTWELYAKPGTEYFGNAYQSAMKAGYEEGYAAQITTAEWFLDKLRRLNMLSKAEKVLDKTLTYEPVDEKGEIKVDLLRVQTDVAKHITKTLGKDEGYSEKSDLNIKAEVNHTGLTEQEEVAMRSLIK
jgi:hypothetical protein